MVVFLDLEDDAEPPEQPNQWSMYHGNGGRNRNFGSGGQALGKEVERPNPNREMGFTKALGCYP